MRRKIQIMGWTLIWSGLFIFGYLGWELFGTDVLNGRAQTAASQSLIESFEETRSDLPPPEEIEPGDALPGRPPIVFHPEVQPSVSDEFARLTIPRIGLEAVLFEGVDRQTLTLGPGHMPGTPIPGQPGNAVISGHRTTYGRPFFDFDRLQPGDKIEVETAIGIHTYEVRDAFVVQPTEVWVTEDKDGAWLTLTTCNPKFSARERLIVTAELVSGPNADYIRYLSEL